MIIIGIMGRTQHGKDTVANILQAQLARHGVRTITYRYDAREVSPAGRWIQAVMRQLEADRPDVAIISDIRHPNEADAVRCRGGLLWKVVRPFVVATDGALRTYESESFVDTMDADTVISNMGGLRDLEATVARHVPRLAEQAGRRPAARTQAGGGVLVPPIHHVTTEWITNDLGSYRFTTPLPDALRAGARQLEAVIQAGRIGWSVWDLERTQIVTMGDEQGDEARRLADKAAGLLGWILPDTGSVP